MSIVCERKLTVPSASLPPTSRLREDGLGTQGMEELTVAKAWPFPPETTTGKQLNFHTVKLSFSSR